MRFRVYIFAFVCCFSYVFFFGFMYIYFQWANTSVDGWNRLAFYGIDKRGLVIEIDYWFVSVCMRICPL